MVTNGKKPNSQAEKERIMGEKLETYVAMVVVEMGVHESGPAAKVTTIGELVLEGPSDHKIVASVLASGIQAIRLLAVKIQQQTGAPVLDLLMNEEVAQAESLNDGTGAFVDMSKSARAEGEEEGDGGEGDSPDG